MATRRTSRAAEARLAFEALSIEGGLLSPAWLARAAALGAPGQTETDYRVPKGLALRDEIGRYWRIAQAHWGELEAGRRSGADAAALARRFVPALLGDVLGFALTPSEPVVVADRAYPVPFFALGGRVPVVVAPVGAGLDAPSVAFGDGGRRRSAFGLAQEYLNAADGAVWGLASDGLVLRVLRDNASLTRPAWIEADLARIFGEERYADFAALWLIAHETRFGRPDRPPADCDLERWREAGREEGTRAREHLRGGVEDALVALGQGFLGHPDNAGLRKALETGALTKDAYFQQLLRLVYRLIFLLTVEERGLLHPEGADPAARARYAEGYALRRLRERSVKRSAHDRFPDAWEALKIVFRGVATGEERLALPALAGIFAKGQCPDLDAARLENRALLLAVFKLCWLRDEGALARVNWRDMGPEELGSVYESLLELVPQIRQDGRTFAFASGGEAKGHARKTTGSYYTPDSLVQVLLDSALEPVVQATIAANPADPVSALLGLSIVDPACGSGHFLLAAARRLAAHVARLQANGTPSAGQYRHALRQVVGRCVYGVDLNPMAVELCKVALWMEAVEPGLPLTFLDAHVRHGNALLGTTPELMAGGVPDAAWEPIEGDDRKVASALKKKNKAERAGQEDFGGLWGAGKDGEAAAVAKAVAEVEAAADGDVGALAAKEERWAGVLGSEGYRRQKFVADAWCAAFVWPKVAAEVEGAPTHGVWRRIRDGGAVSEGTREVVEEVAGRYALFHWHLAFPGVFARGGFDVVLGNPPWEHVEIKEQEWFAERRPEIANAANAAARKRMIEGLRASDPGLFAEFAAASRVVEGENQLARGSGRFPLCAKGRINTYALFAEHNRSVLGPRGRAGFIVPTGIATDDTTKEYFGALVDGRELAAFYSFENEEKVFPGVHHAFRFALMVVDRSGQRQRSDLLFFARQVGAIQEPERHFSLNSAEFALLNPNTRTCPTFRSRRDAEINIAMYRRAGVLWLERSDDGNPWDLRFAQGTFNMASDSGLFRTQGELAAAGHILVGNRFHGPGGVFVPLVEAKMIQPFDHRFGTYADQTEAQSNQGKLPEFDDTAHADPDRLNLPYYWVGENEAEASIQGRWSRRWFVGWRDVMRSTDQRTVVASLIPFAAVGHKFPLMLPDAEPPAVAALYANLCAFALDYAARQKVGGASVAFFIVKQLPILRPDTYEADTPWSRGTALRDWLLPRVLELTYTAWDLEPFAVDVGWNGPPFRWDPDRRFLLRAELDAAYFHLYGLARDDVAYVMDTFPIVRKNDEKAHGEYRTKRVILEVYDEMAEAARTGAPYATRLAPPPADPAVAHPPRGAA